MGTVLLDIAVDVGGVVILSSVDAEKGDDSIAGELAVRATRLLRRMFMNSERVALSSASRIAWWVSTISLTVGDSHIHRIKNLGCIQCRKDNTDRLRDGEANAELTAAGCDTLRSGGERLVAW